MKFLVFVSVYGFANSAKGLSPKKGLTTTHPSVGRVVLYDLYDPIESVLRIVFN